MFSPTFSAVAALATKHSWRRQCRQYAGVFAALHRSQHFLVPALAYIHTLVVCLYLVDLYWATWPPQTLSFSFRVLSKTRLPFLWRLSQVCDPFACCYCWWSCKRVCLCPVAAVCAACGHPLAATIALNGAVPLCPMTDMCVCVQRHFTSASQLPAVRSTSIGNHAPASDLRATPGAACVLGLPWLPCRRVPRLTVVSCCRVVSVPDADVEADAGSSKVEGGDAVTEYATTGCVLAQVASSLTCRVCTLTANHWKPPSWTTTCTVFSVSVTLDVMPPTTKSRKHVRHAAGPPTYPTCALCVARSLTVM